MDNTMRYQERMRFDRLIASVTKNGTLMSLGHLLEWAAKKYGHHKAIICEGKEISYAELFKRTCMFAEKLRSNGVKPEDRVLVWMDNSIELYIAYFAVLQVGAVVALLNIYLTEAELEHIIADAQACCIITEQHYLERLKTGGGHVTILLKEEVISLRDPIVDHPCSIYEKNADALTVLLYTSGTTGLPKGVMLSSRNIFLNAAQGIARQEFKQCKVLCVLPLFHTFAQNTCIWMALLYGCTVIVVPKIERRYLQHALEKKPDIILAVPALYGLLCLMKTAPIADVELFISGGDALPDKIRSAFALIYNRKICNGFGLTETSPLISVDLEDITEPTACVGIPCLETEIDVRDEAGASLPHGQVGILWVKGPQVMLGYYNAPEATAKVLKDGWLNTGDLAYINKHGKIVISGREKDLIIQKGFNIFPQEIENVLMSHPEVIRAAVIGKPDEAGEVPIAVVQTRSEDAHLKNVLKKMCIERLASYKVPKDFIIVRHDLPLTSTGKVNKRELKKTLFSDEKN